PVALTFWRWLLAFTILIPFTAASLHRHRAVIFRSWKVICLLGLFATVLQHIPIYWGLRDTTATNASLLNATSPIFILLLSVMLLGQRLEPLSVFGSVLSMVGVVTIVSSGSLDRVIALHLNPGDVWILVATLSWAAYTVCLRWRPRELGGVDLLTLIAGVSVIALAPLYAIEVASGRELHASVAAFAGIGYVGVVASVLAYMAWNRGVAQIGPARAAPFMYLMLAYTPLLSIALLGERLDWYHLAGGAMIVVGIALATRGRPRG
ncbi:MAG: DMT family transporter, partial [Caldimonas sp.]